MLTPLPDISLRQLEYLVAVADAPTWAMAAQEVGVSPSALSQGLAELERRVGVELFDRDGRRRVLRHSAQPMLDHARQVVSLTGDLVGWAHRLRTAAIGRVSVGMIDIAAVTHFPDVVRQFRAERPDLELRLTVAPSGALLDDLRSGSLDLVVCVQPAAPVPGVETEVLMSEPLSVLAPAGSDLRREAEWGPWVTFPEGSHTRTQIIDALRRRGVPTAVAADSHQPNVLVEMVRMGLGWTVLPTSDRHDLAGIVVGPQILTRDLVIARRAAAVTDPAVDDLQQRLTKTG